MKLVIVESPTKRKTIGRYLGKDYRVFASFGHVRDLAKTGEHNLGIDLEHDFTPQYEVSPRREKLLATLKKYAADAEEVLLATDPDREGEAISWHLADALGLDLQTTKRLSFHEITPYGIRDALEHPATLDMPLVYSQEARRLLDRIIGFRLSNLLRDKIRSQSAGRVQSAALKILVDREREIQAFVVQEYFTATALVASLTPEIKAPLVRIAGEDASKLTQEQVDAVAASLQDRALVTKVQIEEKPHYARPPFTTSTLQQEAYYKFGFSIKKTMKIAQELYEGVELEKKAQGLITYMRTDSIRLSPMFINQAKEQIRSDHGEDYVGTAYRQKESDKVQDAHEAIRPVDVTLTPKSLKKYLSADQTKLYELIYARTLASMMKPRVMKETLAVLEQNDLEFEITTKEMLVDGYSKVYGVYEKLESEPSLIIQEGQSVAIQDLIVEAKQTKPPYRLTEGELVKAMEAAGIGRPSTYVATVDTLKTRHYVETIKGRMKPTEQGMLTTEKLEAYFAELVDAKYTAEMELQLDQIAEGKLQKLELLQSFYQQFEKDVEHASTHMEKVGPLETGESCPQCGKPLVYRYGKFGKFAACSGYPECAYIKPKVDPTPENAKTCPRCNQGKLVIRRSRYGNFLGCDRYPDCDYTERLKKATKKAKEESQ
ncbi:MAG: type I DNA topoisomerase [Bacilli bacterium]|jgi:DNA topoisomerase-1